MMGQQIGVPLRFVTNVDYFPHKCCGALFVKIGGIWGVGSAFQIGPDELLSCSHNCYNKYQDERATEIYYFPAKQVPQKFTFNNHKFAEREIQTGIRVSNFFFDEKFKKPNYGNRFDYEYSFMKMSKRNDCTNYFSLAKSEEERPQEG